jgi:hypothetical protein
LWAVDPTRVPPPLAQPLFVSIGEASRHIAAHLVVAARLEPVGPDFAGDRLYLDQGLDHVGCATSAYRDERIYRWLRGRHR